MTTRARGLSCVMFAAILFSLHPLGLTATAASEHESSQDSPSDGLTLDEIISEPQATPYVYGGGSVANPGWVASITVRDSYLCAGSLIHQQWVLTAAHCADGVDPSYRVHVGSGLWYDGQERTITRVEIHPAYDPFDETSVDLALLELSSPVTGVSLPTLATSPAWPVAGQPLIVVGWGETSTNSPPAGYLQAASVTANSDSNGVPDDSTFCNIAWVAASGYDDFCFGTISSWACRGDSGGPLVGRTTPQTQSGAVNTIYGVTSFGDSGGCSSAFWDSVGQSISPHISWLRDFIPQPGSAGAGDEMFFYRGDGLYRFYDVRNTGSLSKPIQAGEGYTQNWNTITGIDLDGDGQDEMFFYRRDGLFRFYNVRPDGSLPTPMRAGDGYTKNWTAITAIDLDGDGQDEMFFYRDDGLYRFYDVRLNGSIGSPILAGDGYTTGWDSITAVDLDGDGQDEMFFYRDDGLYRYYAVRPNGQLPRPMLQGSGYTKNWSTITAIDLQGDGKDEIFFYRSDGLYRFYAIKPDATLGQPIRAGNDYTTGWSSIAAVNLDGR